MIFFAWSSAESCYKMGNFTEYRTQTIAISFPIISLEFLSNCFFDWKSNIHMILTTLRTECAHIGACALL